MMLKMSVIDQALTSRRGEVSTRHTVSCAPAAGFQGAQRFIAAHCGGRNWRAAPCAAPFRHDASAAALGYPAAMPNFGRDVRSSATRDERGNADHAATARERAKPRASLVIPKVWDEGRLRLPIKHRFSGVGLTSLPAIGS